MGDSESPTEFLVSLHNEIDQCIKAYDRNLYVKFRQKVQLIPDDVTFAQIDAHNSWIFRTIKSTKPPRSIMRSLIFLIFSPNLSISDLFNSLTILTPKVSPDNFFYKTIHHIHNILIKDPENLFEQFSKKFTPQNVKWVHFCVIGKNISSLPPNDVSAVMRSFLSVSTKFKNKEFLGVSKFIRGINPPIFEAFVKPFLDQQILRNTDSFITILPNYLKHLKFCKNIATPHHGTDYIETVSHACESSNEKTVSHANLVVSLMASHISPKVFPFNQKSIIPYFNSATICKASVEVAFNELQKSTSQITKMALFSFLTKASHQHPPLFDVNKFVEQYLIKPPQFIFLYLMLNVPSLNSQPFKEITMNQNNLICLAIRAKLNLYKLKESDLDKVYLPQIFRKYSQDEVEAYSEVLYQIRNEIPEFAAKSFVFSTISTSFQGIVLSAFNKSIAQCSTEFLNGLFKTLRLRNPNELRPFIPILKNYLLKYSDHQKVICMALGIDNIEGDENVIIQGLFSLLNGEWRKNAENAIIRLCGNSKFHPIISKRILPHSLDSDYTNILSSLFLNFNIESDRQLFETVFLNQSNTVDKIMIKCISTHSPYSQYPSILCKVLKSPNQAAEIFDRKFIFSLLPKSNFREFDFLLFLPFYKVLLEVPEYDEICERIGKILCQFDYISFERSEIIDELEDFLEADQVLAHLYASDKLTEKTDAQVAQRIVKRQDFAKFFRVEMEKYDKIFYTEEIITAMTTHNIYIEPLPPIFKKYLNYMASFGLNNDIMTEITANTVFKYYKSQINTVVDNLIEFGVRKPELTLAILSKLTSIGSKQQTVFNFLMNLKKPQINPSHFNSVVQQFLLPEFSDKIIEKFFSVPEFRALPDETLPSLYYSLKTSSKSIPYLFDLIKTQCNPKCSDRTIEILIQCLRVLRQSDNSALVVISNQLVSNFEKTKSEILGLVFHFCTTPNKMEMLGQWITSNNMKAKALMILRYLFTIPSEASHLHTLLNNLISLTTNPDMRIVESATNALRAAANSLSPTMVDEITPFIISTIKPESTRFALEADLQFLIQVEKNNSLILLPYLPSLFLALQDLQSRNSYIDELFSLIEDHLKQSNNKTNNKEENDKERPGLYVDIVKMIRTNKKPLEVYKKIDEKIEDTRKDVTLTNIAYTMIERDLTNIDINIKLISFKILAELNLSDELFEKASLTFYRVSYDPHRNEISPHFKTFLNRCSLERKQQIFELFLEKVGTDTKNFQSDGFSFLFGTILAYLNDESYISSIIQKIKVTSNTLIRESLMNSLTEMFETNKELIIHQLIPISKCFLTLANSNDSFKLMKRITNYLTNDVLYQFMDLVVSFMSSPVADVREICNSLFLLLLRSHHPFDTLYIFFNHSKSSGSTNNSANNSAIISLNSMNTHSNSNPIGNNNLSGNHSSTDDSSGLFANSYDNYLFDEKEVFNKLFAAVICTNYDYTNSVSEKADHLLSLLVQNAKITDDYYVDSILPKIDHFLDSEDQKVNLLGIYGIVHIIRKVYNNKTLMEKLILTWIQMSSTNFPDQLVRCFKETVPFDLRAEIAKFIVMLIDDSFSISSSLSSTNSSTNTSTNIPLVNSTNFVSSGTVLGGAGALSLNDDAVGSSSSNIPLIQANSIETIDSIGTISSLNIINDLNMTKSVLVNSVIPMTPESCAVLIYSFIDARKYLDFINIANQNWPTQTSSSINNALQDLFSLAHRQINIPPRISATANGQNQQNGRPVSNTMKFDSLPSQFKYREAKLKLSGDDEINIKRKSIEPFITLSISLANDTVIEFIKNIELTPPDTVLIQLIGRMAHNKPEFFIQYASTFAEAVLPIFFHDVPTDDIRIIEESILAIINRSKPMEIARFFRNISPTFFTQQRRSTRMLYTRRVLSDQFVSSLIDETINIVQKSDNQEMLPDFAYFLRSIFQFTSDKIRTLKANLLIKAFISAIVKNDALSQGSADMIGAMRLFSTFIQNNTEILFISEISSVLTISRITPEIQCELISLIDCAMSMSVNNLLLLKLFEEKASVSPSPSIFECISYIIEFSPKFRENILMHLWNSCCSTNIKSENQSVRISIAKVGSLVCQQVYGENRDSIFDDVLTSNSNDSLVYCSFLNSLKSLDILRQDHHENIRRLLSISDPISCEFISLIPMLARSGKKALLSESMNYLVRGLRSKRYIVPSICLSTLKALQNELREMDIKESAVIITGLYFSFCRFKGELKNKSYETLQEILGKGQKSTFREIYFKTLDSSLAQAFQRDIFASS